MRRERVTIDELIGKLRENESATSRVNVAALESNGDQLVLEDDGGASSNAPAKFDIVVKHATAGD